MSEASHNEKAKGKRYFTIGEVAETLEVNSSLIRYWEKNFPRISPKKNRKGHRLFTKDDIETLKFIHFLVKEKGYTLDHANKILQNQNKKAQKEFQMAETLKKTKAFLLELKQNLGNGQ